MLRAPNRWIRLGDLVSGVRTVAAIIARSSALSGPRIVTMILSGECNSQCVMCWYHSPLLDCDVTTQPEAGHAQRQRFMDRTICESILRQCRALGTYRVVLGGHGEPTIHPSFDDLLHLTGNLGMESYVITNGLSVDPPRAASWARQRAHFRFSLHAGDPETWLAVHPRCVAADFERIEQAIRVLARSKTATVSAMHVIQRANIKGLRQTVQHARELGLRQLLYMPVRADGPRASVLLDPAEQAELRATLVDCSRQAAKWGIRTNLGELLTTNRFTQTGVPQTAELYRRIPCYVGYFYTEFDIEGYMRPCEGSEIVFGRVGDDDLARLWRSQRYETYRRETRGIVRRRVPVSGCPCDTCTMTQFNLNVHRLLRLQSIRYGEA